MTTAEFQDWITGVQDNYEENNHELINQVLINDENSSDNELLLFLIKNNIDADYIKTLIPMRNYFWDFRYSQLV
jgi:hypothetical protein